MIDSIDVELDGEVYHWAYDPLVESSSKWWSDDKYQTDLPFTLVNALNRLLLNSHAEALVAGAEPTEMQKVLTILRELGAGCRGQERSDQRERSGWPRLG